MTFTQWLLDKRWKFYEDGNNFLWGQLWLLSQVTPVGTVGDADMDATFGNDQGAGQQDLPHSDAGKVVPDPAADVKVPPSQFRS